MPRLVKNFDLSLQGLYMNNGQRQDAALGYDFDRSYYNMNCNFGSSIHIQPENYGGRGETDGGYVYIGAPLHHHQGENSYTLINNYFIPHSRKYVHVRK